MKHIIDAFHNRPLVRLKDRNFLINPLIDQQPATSPELLKDVVEEITKLTDFSKANKILGEEDRGGFIAALLAYATNRHLGMVKWNPIELEGQISVDFRNAYTHGKMYLNGIEKGDKVIIVEDLIDSGGTVISMIELLRKAEVEILDVLAIAEKAEFEGIKRIEKETGVKVKHLLTFTSVGKLSEVIWTINR